MTDRRQTLARARGLWRGCGCLGAALGGGGLLVALVGAVWLFMSSSHTVRGPAEELGLTRGPSHGIDGWYVGVWNGHDVALAATYGFDDAGNSPAGTRRDEEIELVLRVDGSVDGGFVWESSDFDGEGMWPSGWQGRARRFAEEYGSLVVTDVPRGQLPFDRGVAVSHTWQAARPSTAEVEARLRALAEVVSTP